MRLLTALLATSLMAAPAFARPDFAPAIEADYAAHLEKLFIDFHKNPELSFKETRTAAIMAKELRAVGGDLVACHFAETLPPMTREATEAESPALARRLDILAQARKDAA